MPELLANYATIDAALLSNITAIRSDFGRNFAPTFLTTFVIFEGDYANEAGYGALINLISLMTCLDTEFMS